MKSKNFSKALGEINDKYITEASEYQAKESKHRFNWKSLVACAAVIALFFGTRHRRMAGHLKQACRSGRVLLVSR